MYLKSLVSGSELLWSLIEEFDAENDEGVDMESDEEEDDEVDVEKVIEGVEVEVNEGPGWMVR